MPSEPSRQHRGPWDAVPGSASLSHHALPPSDPPRDALRAAVAKTLDDHDLMTNPAECVCGDWTYRDERPGNYFRDHQVSAVLAALPPTASEPAPTAEAAALRDWQRDLLAFDADGLTLPQVVADLLGVKSVDLRVEQGDDGTPQSSDRRWRVQFFGGTYGGTLHEVLTSALLSIRASEPATGAGALNVERLADAIQAELDLLPEEDLDQFQMGAAAAYYWCLASLSRDTGTSGAES